jgi:hypothetical protein
MSVEAESTNEASKNEAPPAAYSYPRDQDGGPYTDKMRAQIEYVQDVTAE